MKAKKNNKGEIGKLIFLPEKTLKDLKKLAEAERMTTKPYIEKILIDHAKQN